MLYIMLFHATWMKTFGQIIDILILPNSNCLFVLKPYISSHFAQHYHSFVVTPVQSKLLYYYPHELLDFHPLYFSKSFHATSPVFVRCKYNLCT